MANPTAPTLGSPMPVNPQCRACKTEQGLVRCQGCQVVFYCGRDHQASDWSQHKVACTPIKRSRNKVAREVDMLNSMPSSFMFQEKPFENSVGHFWGIVDTRDYMRARYDHVEALLKVKNRTAVQSALDHLLDMLRLNRSDNMGLRNLVPALYLRLSGDQEAYDFLKWWFTSGRDSDYDWGDTNLPYLNIKNADASEPVATLKIEYADLSHRAMLCLLKWRLLSSLQSLDSASAVAGDKVPAELLNQIRSHMLSSATQNNLALMRDVENGRDIGGHISQLAQQVETLFDTLDDANKHYWKAVIEPGTHLTARPPHYSHGNVAEMQLTLAQTYDAWVETPGALQWLRCKVAS